MPCLVKLLVTEEITAGDSESIKGAHECLLVNKTMVAVWVTVLRVCLDNKPPVLLFYYHFTGLFPCEVKLTNQETVFPDDAIFLHSFCLGFYTVKGEMHGF